jgi:hypothetical protein|nr:MAG TPA: Cytochrome oxidase c subunit VIII [Caudoviricetes sp.]
MSAWLLHVFGGLLISLTIIGVILYIAANLKDMED